MPSFTSTLPNLQAAGPLVNIQVIVGSAVENALVKAALPIPPPVQVAALIDTGASGSVLQAGIPATLGLNPIGVTLINTPSSTNVPCHEYAVRILFPNNVLFETVVVEAPLQGQNIQCLIGRNVLSRGVLVYIGYANLFSLSF